MKAASNASSTISTQPLPSDIYYPQPPRQKTNGSGGLNENRHRTGWPNVQQLP
jgi:hypothetical protein